MTENRSSSPGVKDNADSSSPRSEDVLRNIGINVASEDADLALARALQEQERAFMLFAAQQQQGSAAAASASDSQPAERDPADGIGSRSEPPLPPAAAEVVVLSDGEAYDDAEEQDYDDDEDDEDPAGPRQGDAGGGAGAALTDEELALQLQVEEQHAHMLELAGFGPDGVYEDDDLDDEEYYPEDEVDPDNMTYEELQALGDALGTVSKGVPQAAVDALPRSQYSLPSAAAAAPGKRSGSRRKGVRSPTATLEPDKCAVCQMEFEPGDEVLTLPCSHFYHPNCIGEWLKDRKVCPICGKELTLQKPSLDGQRSSPAIPAGSAVPSRQSGGT